jgi:hypothetical protein
LALAVLFLCIGSSAISQTKPPDVAGKASVPIQADIELQVLAGPTAQMSLTFKSALPLKEPVLAVLALDVDVAREKIGDLVERRGVGGSIEAIFLEAREKELWFGNTIQVGQAGQRSTTLQVQLPGIIKTTAKGFELAFKSVVDGALKRIAGESSTVFQARVASVRLNLPEGWERVDADKNDKSWERIDSSGRRFDFKGDADGKLIVTQFKRDIPPWQEWMEKNIAAFFSVLLAVLGVASIAKRNMHVGRANLRTYLLSLIGLGICMAYLLADWLLNTSQTWFERNWFMVSAFCGFLLSIVVPSQWIDVLLKAIKPDASGEIKSEAHDPA